MRASWTIGVAVVLLAALGTGGSLQAQTAAEKEAVEAIMKLGGEVGTNGDKPGTPIVRVAFTNGKATDEVMKEVAKLKNLQYLNLENCKDVTAAGLKELKGLKSLNHLTFERGQCGDAELKEIKALTGLKHLNLGSTQVTDEGMKELRGLGQLEYLRVGGTKVSDKGLEALKGMRALKNIHAFNSEVTQAGAMKFQKANPKVSVTR